MKKDGYYDKNFYANMVDAEKITAVTSAQEIVPYILKLFPKTTSVVDVGCATGTWLKVFAEHGIKDIRGIDGSWVARSSLLIPTNQFQEYNLGKKYIADRQFDLVISLEVAEHIEAKKADNFIDTLTSLGTVVIFSAAIPNQGGTLHVNEQYQSWWARKFEKRGYVPFDVFRLRFNHDERCRIEYAQNMILYVKEDVIGQYPQIEKFMCGGVLDFIHPGAIVVKSSHAWKYIFYVQKMVIQAICKKILHKFGIRTKTV